FRPHDILIGAYIEPRYWAQGFREQDAFIIVTNEDVVVKRISNKIASEKHIVCISDNPEFAPYTIDADAIREVWKVRMKITRSFEKVTENYSSDINQQLQQQASILKELQQKFLSVKAS